MAGFDNLDQLSRDELEQKARDAGIPGVSNMSKEDIISALKRMGGKSGILD